MYAIDNHLGTAFGVDAKGNLINMSDTAPIGSGNAMDITVTPSNRIFVASRDAQGIQEISTKDYRVVNQFGESKKIGQGRDAFAYPNGIVADSKNRLFVMYPDTSTIEAYDPDGKHLGTIEGKFDGARGIAATSKGEKTLVAVPEFAGHKVTLIELDPGSLKQSGTTSIDTGGAALSACFDESGNLYVGTQSGVDRYENGKKTGHWESKNNDKGHQVWGVAIKGDQLICTEGSDNEKYWMKGSLKDFKPVAGK
jgi:sugar lactone lactonase YvrE